MSLLPTAHAGQSFGARRIDFYTVSGEVSASDDATGRITDTDGMVHDVRLLDRSNALAPGDTASVLRVQAGPNRRSRPAAIVNHTRETWMRAGPDATTLLARSGITRSVNWWLSVLVLALVAIAAVWPAIHGFLSEVNAGLMTSIPALDVFDEIGAFLPALSGWRLESALPGGLLDTITALGFVPMTQLTEWGVALGAGILTLLTFFGRSWRLVYVPALGALALAAGAILGSALPTLAVIAGSVAFFMIGGMFNRVRDSGRFNARVSRLAEHALRNPPHEGVRSGDNEDSAASGMAASAAIAAATATAQGDGDGPDQPTGDSRADDTAPAAEDAAEEQTPESHGSGDAEAPDQNDLLPAAPSTADGSEASSDAEPAAPEAAGEVAASTEPEGAAESGETAPGDPDETATDPVSAADEVAAPDAAPDATAETVGETAEDTAPESVSDPVEASAEAHDAEPDATANDNASDETADEAVDGAAGDAATATDDTQAADDPVTPVDDALDDDLPSLDDVAAAAALTESEGGADSLAVDTAPETPRTALDLDDDRTMPVAPPPPMPGDSESGDSEPSASEPSASVAGASLADSGEPAPAPSHDDATDAAPDTVDMKDAAPQEPGAEEPGAEAATPHPASSASITDDPMMDEAGDPMVSADGAGDLAPGAPEIELDRTPAE